jgi:adenylate cyclase
MEAKTLISTNRIYIATGTIAGGFLGLIYSLLEYSLGTERSFFALLILGLSIGILIGLSVTIFEAISGLIFKHRTFVQAVLIRTSIYLVIILGWLVIINTISNMVIYRISILEGLLLYINYESFAYNLIFAFVGISIVTVFYQISKLHRKGELGNYILGRYHKPREVNQIFLCVDLKSSTKIAEMIGNINYGRFLQDYYADITEAIIKTKAIVYQYVGDEIVVTWPMNKGIEKHRCMQFVIEMKKTFNNYKEKYDSKYGFFPEFRAGLHGGKVLITWIGEVKKEIVFVGDVLNTAARIAEECKKANQDFLLSGDIYDKLNDSIKNNCSFYNQLQLRGKEEEIKIYSFPLS